ncbi:MAG: hypothetical protein JKY96_05875 [Phycisphaerales bacterium]|nr:hypothetical protein [Phycisphaerales bacterium]
MHTSVSASIMVALSVSSALASPFATTVVDYNAGTNANPQFTDATTALGSAERFTGELTAFAGGVTPFNPAFGTDEIVSVGSGGFLTFGFDQAITNDASHTFGIDFIVFGNASFFDSSFPNGSVGNTPTLFGSGGVATIEVSTNGIDWELAAITTLDLFPTLGFQDYFDPFATTPGTIETDFTQAMDPALGLNDLAGLNYAQLLDLYNGSGGGIGIDIDSTGLASVNFVRFTNNSAERFEIDAVSVVPASSALALLSLGLMGATQRRRQ